MRLAIVNQFFLPDISPTAQLAGSLAEHRAALGDTVTVVCGAGRYAPVGAGPGAGPAAGVEVVRVPTLGLGKRTVLLRAADYLAFFLLAVVKTVALPRQDVIVSLTTPPYVVLAAVLHKLARRRTKVVLWSMDCYPEVAEMAGLLRKGSLPSRALRAVNRWVFGRLDYLVGLDRAMVDQLVTQYAAGPGRPPAEVVPNWERADQFPAAAAPPAWDGVAKLGLAGRFVVLYLGNLGTGHEFGTALDAADRLRADPVTFLFVGGGVRWADLEKAKAARGLGNVVLTGYVPKEQTGAVMAACHAALITLRDEAVGLISPSKLHSNLAAGLPVAYVGPPRSNVDDAVADHGVGVSLRVGDAAGLAGFVTRLRTDPGFHAGLRRKARAAFDAAYCDSEALPRFDRVLGRLAAPRSPR